MGFHIPVGYFVDKLLVAWTVCHAYAQIRCIKLSYVVYNLVALLQVRPVNKPKHKTRGYGAITARAGA